MRIGKTHTARKGYGGDMHDGSSGMIAPAAVRFRYPPRSRYESGPLPGDEREDEMSRETSEHLNTNVLVGCTDKRGNAWHYRADLQTPWAYATDTGEIVTGIGNHYPKGIPLVDVKGRLFNWEPLTAPVYAATGIQDDGTTEYTPIPNQVRVYPSDDPSHTFWIAKESYQPHEYGDALGNSLADLLDTSSGDLVISSAGLLKQRAIAWVECSVPDSITTPDGIEFRPNILATTSLNGTVATTWKRTATMVVCDNTWAGAMAEDGATYKVKHSKYSNLKIADARTALNIIHDSADELEKEFAALCRIDVTDAQFFDIVKEMTAPEVKTGKEASKRALTIQERKSEELSQLWRNDNRVSPWAGTGFGVVQAFNTWEHHFKGTRSGTSKAERNALAAVSGDIERSDAEVIATMEHVLDRYLTGPMADV